MKRLLYFAYYFPPLGGAGVQRSLKFVRYLPQFGWRATVVTAEAAYWMEDETLLREIDPETRILRVPFPLARGAGRAEDKGAARSHGRIRWLRSLTRWIALPDAYRLWAVAAGRAGAAELRLGGYDAVLTTSSPDSTHLIGRALRRSHRVPWVADFRDPWTRRLSYAPPTPLHHAWQRRMERACTRSADRLIVTCDETRDEFLRQDARLDPARFVVIPNGYDAEDFAQAEAMPLPSWIPSAGFDLLHAGQLNPERPIEPFLHGLRRYLDRQPAEAGRRKVALVGGHYDRDREAVRTCGLDGVVELRPSQPHLESIRALLCARALLLLEQDSDRGRLVLPGKFWEYAYARRPILALVPRGGAADRMVRELKVGLRADPSDPAAIAGGLERIWSGPAPTAAEVDLRPFERRELARRLARELDGLSVEQLPIGRSAV